MPNQVLEMDRAFQALANPCRRGVLERLGRGPASMTELAEPWEMAPPSFLQHLRVLESAGLVTSKKEGRVRTYQLELGPLQEAEHWLEARRREWNTRLDQLDSLLNQLKDNS